MRIISGSKRGMNLQTPEGLGTRPTSDRIKETLFNMISFDIPGCRFLDLFSGSGQMGIEALSRGASEAVFVEKEKSAISCIENNLSKAKFDEEATLYKEDVFSALNKLGGSEAFDFVFMDPPYNKLIEKQVLEALANKSYITDETTIIVEASLDTDIDYISDLGYTVTKVKTYKTNKHIFLKKA